MKRRSLNLKRAAALWLGWLGIFGGALVARAGDQDMKIILLLGQSNMEGQAYTYSNAATTNWNIPTLDFLLSGSAAAANYLANMPHGFKDSLAPSWQDIRTDAWCVHYDSSTGAAKDVLPTRDPGGVVNGIQRLSPGFGVNTGFGSMFGAELAMGIRLADAVAAPVFLFKSDKGGTTLGNDWRPPTAVAARGGSVGINYSNTLVRFTAFLDALDADLAGNGVLDAYNHAPGYEVSAVFWLQGWNEQYDDGPYTAAQLQAEYDDNLKDLIHSIRAADPRIPSDLPIIIAESSDQNAALNAARQSAVADLNLEIPGSAVYFDTDNMIGVNWGNNDAGVPFASGWGYHFHARAENFLEIGWKAAGAVLEAGYITQPPLPGVMLSKTSLSVAEGGVNDTYTLVLATAPTHDVVVTLQTNSEITVSTTQVTFTTNTWNQPQTITVTAVDDAEFDITHAGLITHSVASSDTNYNGIAVAGLPVSITDNTEIYAVPFQEPFDLRQTGNLHGQYGWVAEGAVVQTSTTFAMSAKAAQVSDDGGYLKHTFNDARTKVWIDMRVRVTQMTSTPTPVSPSTGMFYVSTNAMVMAFSGTNIVATGITVAQGEWTRFTMFNDYTAKTYILYVNDIRAGKYNFYSADVPAFMYIKIKGKDTYVDDVGVTPNQPAMRGMPSLIMLR